MLVRQTEDSKQTFKGKARLAFSLHRAHQDDKKLTHSRIEDVVITVEPRLWKTFAQKAKEDVMMLNDVIVHSEQFLQDLLVIIYFPQVVLAWVSSIDLKEEDHVSYVYTRISRVL